jgi:GXWXG protein/Domain of unknown function (DUF4334)
MGHYQVINQVAQFQDLKKQQVISNDKVLSDLFDALPPASSEEVFGKWQGGGFDTGHWLLSALAEMKWYGKWIHSQFDVKPLVCYDEAGRLYSNKSLNGEASVGMMEFRGKVSATIIYDGVPMFGHLRKVDNDTLLGVVNGKSVAGNTIVPDGKHQYFFLERLDHIPAEFVEK